MANTTFCPQSPAYTAYLSAYEATSHYYTASYNASLHESLTTDLRHASPVVFSERASFVVFSLGAASVAASSRVVFGDGSVADPFHRVAFHDASFVV